MSKRWISVLVTVFTVMLLATGCNSDKKVVTESVEDFLNAVVAKDMERDFRYVSGECMKRENKTLQQTKYKRQH